jgi:hypothetical protein
MCSDIGNDFTSTGSATMRLPPDSPRREDEERRYFPDWNEPLVENREELEADHNSYLAGGYAEEFGYHAQPGSSRGVPVLDGEPPEDSAEWLGQAAITHPGYPIRPRPVALDGEQTASGSTASRKRQVVAAHEAPLGTAGGLGHRGTFVRVTERPYEHERHHAGQRAAAVLTRFLAALATLSWGLPHRRKSS